MSDLATKQRIELIKERGEPILQLEFDVFNGGEISMWTHFKHEDKFEDVERILIEIRNHLQDFIKSKRMCPFHLIKKES